MRLSSLAAVAALASIGSVSRVHEDVLIVGDDYPEPRRRAIQPKAHARTDTGARFQGDGHDADRIAAAERKRARKAARIQSVTSGE
jgi:hypothetical protein